MSAIVLSLQAGPGVNPAPGYPARIRLDGNVIMESWQPAAAPVQARTMRAASDVDGPAIHPRVRSLIREDITLLVKDTAPIEQASRLLNAINANAATGWLHAQRLDTNTAWRAPLKSGSLQLDGSSLRFADGQRRYHMTLMREPYFEAAGAPTVLGSSTLRSRRTISLTAPAVGTLAAPLTLTLQATGAVAEALRIHLFQDRAAPAGWSPNYRCVGTGLMGGDLRFTAVRPNDKNMELAALYRPVLMPNGAANIARVAAHRDAESFSAVYGGDSDDLWAESELGRLGRLDGRVSIFTGIGMAEIIDEVDYLRLRGYARPFAMDASWALLMAPLDGRLSVTAAGTGLLAGGPAGGPLYLAPSERCVILALIETVAAVEYSDTVLLLQASLRPRISELI